MARGKINGMRRWPVHPVIARQATEELRVGERLIDPWDLEVTGALILREAGTCDPILLATRMGIFVERRLRLRGGDAVTGYGGICVRAGMDPARERAAIAHELAHIILPPRLHTHADVWVLTFSLLGAFPLFEKMMAEAPANDLEWALLLTVPEG